MSTAFQDGGQLQLQLQVTPITIDYCRLLLLIAVVDC